MRELWRQSRARWDNPIWLRRKRREPWWMPGVYLVTWLVCFVAVHLSTKTDAFQWNLIMTAALTLAVVQLHFSHSRRRNRDEELQELLLTRLTREEIAYGFLIEHIRYAIQFWIIGSISMLVVAITKGPSLFVLSTFESLAFAFAFVVAVIGWGWLLIMSATRYFFMHQYGALRAMGGAIVQGFGNAFRIALASMVFIMATGILFSPRNAFLIVTCSVILAVLITCIIVTRWTFLEFPSRLLGTVEKEERRQRLWIINEEMDADEKARRRISLGQMAERLWKSPAAVMLPIPFIILIATATIHLTGWVRIWEAETPFTGLFANQSARHAASICFCVGYLLFLGRRGTPVVAGALGWTAAYYALIPVLFSAFAILLTFPPSENERMFHIALSLVDCIFLPTLILAIVLTMLSHGGKVAKWWFCLAILIYGAGIYDYQWPRIFHEAMVQKVNVVMGAVISILFTAGFPLMFQKLHDRRVTADVMRGELTEPIQ